MGLDTYATKRNADGDWEVAPDRPFDGIELCGGICSGGQGSSLIRGNDYAEVVLAATGTSLYQERIEPSGSRGWCVGSVPRWRMRSGPERAPGTASSAFSTGTACLSSTKTAGFAWRRWKSRFSTWPR